MLTRWSRGDGARLRQGAQERRRLQHHVDCHHHHHDPNDEMRLGLALPCLGRHGYIGRDSLTRCHKLVRVVDLLGRLVRNLTLNHFWVSWDPQMGSTGIRSINDSEQARNG